MTTKRTSRSISFSPSGYEVIQHLQHQCNINISKYIEKLLLKDFEKIRGENKDVQNN